MELKTKYVLHVSFESLDFAFKEVFGPDAKWFKFPYVESCEGLYEGDDNHARVVFSEDQKDGIKFSNFIKLMCYALPKSRHNLTGFYVINSIIANKNTAVSIQNGGVIDINRKHLLEKYKTFNVDEKAFNKNAYKKLLRIKDICDEGNQHY